MSDPQAVIERLKDEYEILRQAGEQREDHLQTQISVLKSKLSKYQDEFKEEPPELEELQMLHSSLQHRLKSLRTETKSMIKQREREVKVTMQAKLRDVERKFEEAQANRETPGELKQSLRRSNRDVMWLKGEAERLEKELRKAHHIIAEHETEIEQLRADRRHTLMDSLKAQQTIKTVQEKNVELETIVQDSRQRTRSPHIVPVLDAEPSPMLLKSQRRETLVRREATRLHSQVRRLQRELTTARGETAEVSEAIGAVFRRSIVASRGDPNASLSSSQRQQFARALGSDPSAVNALLRLCLSRDSALLADEMTVRQSMGGGSVFGAFLDTTDTLGASTK